jgi:hypothetical protein
MFFSTLFIPGRRGAHLVSVQCFGNTRLHSVAVRCGQLQQEKEPGASRRTASDRPQSNQIKPNQTKSNQVKVSQGNPPRGVDENEDLRINKDE